MYKTAMDFRLHCNRTMCVVGPSHSGKTTFVLQLLEKKEEVFQCEMKRVVWCYGIYQHELHSKLQEQGHEVHNGIIPVSEIQPYDIVILDDLIHESKNSQDVTAMFTRAAHHKPCFIIFITQNLFPPGKEARMRNLNTHYYVIFKNPRDKSQFEVIARQIRARNVRPLIDIFEDATKKPFSYLFLDLTQECPDAFRFRSNLFEGPMIIYKPQ